MLTLPISPTTESIHNDPSVLLGLENVSEAVAISQIYFIQAEVNVIASAIPVNGGHLRLTCHLKVRQYPHMCRHVVGP